MQAKKSTAIRGGNLYDLLLDRLVENEDSRKRKPRYFTIDGSEIVCHSKEYTD